MHNAPLRKAFASNLTSDNQQGSINLKTLAIPQLSLVTLIGPSGSGKSTFARTHFLPTEVISSDACRG